METVSIRIPASPAYVKVVRLVASGIATRLKFTLDEIEDLKIAVDELAAYFTGIQGRQGRLEILFRVHEDRIEIKAETERS
jgi:serine/threonine-protein kinase RsbW